ncbi:MAG TPA: hypothetical protein PLP61_11295 [Nocardioides sp.]|nr:hypothetical protein [Nocardioides sp.]HQR27614.1 hypothetical protein [Nocardioides sp.]
MNSYPDIEKVARQLITERSTPTRRMPRTPRRTQLAHGLRRVADRLDG